MNRELNKLILDEDYQGVVNEVIELCLKSPETYKYLEEHSEKKNSAKYYEDRDREVFKKQLNSFCIFLQSVIQNLKEFVNLSEEPSKITYVLEKLNSDKPLADLDFEQNLMVFFEISEDELSTILQLGEKLSLSKKWKRAFDIFNFCTIIQPNSFKSWKNLGITYFASKENNRFYMAEHCFRKAHSLKPNDISIIFCLIEVYFRSNRIREANYLLDELLNRQSTMSSICLDRLKLVQSKLKPASHKEKPYG